jgi:hypothetical protein
VRISGGNAGYTMFRGSVRVQATRSIRHFPLYFPSRASPCAITFQTQSNSLLLETHFITPRRFDDSLHMREKTHRFATLHKQSTRITKFVHLYI